MMMNPTSLTALWSGIMANRRPSADNPIAVVVAHPLTMEFIAGAAAGILVRRKMLTLAGPALVAGFVLLPAVLALPDMLTAFITDGGWMRVLVIGVPCALVVYGAAAIERRGLPLVSDWLVALGDASYSIYLAHVLVAAPIERAVSLYGLDDQKRTRLAVNLRR